jgi:hypothetical protein
MTWIVNNCYLSFIVWIAAQKVLHYFILRCGSIVTKTNPSSLLRNSSRSVRISSESVLVLYPVIEAHDQIRKKWACDFLIGKTSDTDNCRWPATGWCCMKWEVKTPAKVGCRNAAEIETTPWSDPPASCRKGSQFPIRDIQCGSSFLLFSI